MLLLSKWNPLFAWLPVESIIHDRQDEMIDENISPEDKRWKILLAYLEDHETVRNADICRLLDVSSATANRLLHPWTDADKLEQIRDGRTWAYRLRG